MPAKHTSIKRSRHTSRRWYYYLRRCRDALKARKMRMLIKKLLKKHKYPPEGMDDAVQTVMLQCELWTDNTDMMEERVSSYASRLGEYVSEINKQ